MARGRMVVRTIGESVKVFRLYEKHGAEAALCWTWLIPWIDRNGNLRGDPEWIKVNVLPRQKVTAAEVREWLITMADVGLVQPYEIGGLHYMNVPGFRDEQVGLRWQRETREVPIPPGFDVNTGHLLMTSPEKVEPPSVKGKNKPAIGKLSLQEVLDLAAAHNLPDGWMQGCPSGAEIIGWWIDALPERPPNGAVKRMGKVANRIGAENDRQAVVRAVLGMSLIFPHADASVVKGSPGRAWDIFNLERSFTAAHAAVAPDDDSFERAFMDGA